MKKIVALIVFVMAFSMNMNAQDKEIVDAKAKTDALELIEFVNASEDVKMDLFGIFQMKHESLQTEGISEERKAVLAQYVEQKLQAVLTEEQFKKLRANDNLYDRLLKK